MKTKKMTRILSVLITLLVALLALTFASCSHSGSSDKDEPIYNGNGGVTDSQPAQPTGAYKVELGVISFADYRSYSDRLGTGTVWTAAMYKEQRDTWYGQTREGTYQDKGRLSASELRAFLLQNGQVEIEADSVIDGANACGCFLTNFFQDATYETVTWVYVEK